MSASGTRPTSAKLAATARMIDEAAKLIGAEVEWLCDSRQAWALLMRDDVEIAVGCCEVGAVSARGQVYATAQSLAEAAYARLASLKELAIKSAESWTESFQREEAERASARERMRACGQALLRLVKK